MFKIHGVGPRQVTDKMMDLYFKYNSGGKKFTQIHTKHLTATIDAFTIHNSLWLGKKTKLPDKDSLALVVWNYVDENTQIMFNKYFSIKLVKYILVHWIIN